jgi:excisionase family DNA binding protein
VRQKLRTAAPKSAAKPAIQQRDDEQDALLSLSALRRPIVQPVVHPGYTDEKGAADYVGISRDTFRRLVKRGVFKRGFPLTPGGKHMFKFSDLDAAMAKAARSRKPKREPRGIVRQRLEAGQDGAADA